MNPTPHIIESALLLLAAFLIGCVAGYFLRRILKKGGAGERSAEPAVSAEPVTASAMSGAAMPASASGRTEASVMETGEPATPEPAEPVQPATKPRSAAKAKTAAKPKAAAKPAARAKTATGTKTRAAKAPASSASKTAAKRTAPARAKPAETARLEGPRGGVANDLKKIKGIGPRLEAALNENGIYHYDQIARWSRADIAAMDEKLSLRGRIERDEWVSQAKALAKWN